MPTLNARQDRRRHIVSACFLQYPSAAGDCLRALGQRLFHKAKVALKLRDGVHRANLCFKIKRIAHLELFRFRRHQCNKLIMHCALNQEPRTSYTDLPRIAENPHRRNLGGFRKIRRIGKNDIRRLATKLQIDAFEIGAR